MRDAGLRLAYGSDHPVTSLDPLASLAAALSPQDPVQGDAKGFSRAEALHMVTEGAAAACGFRDTGRIAVGFRGDFVVLSTDFAVAAVEEVRTAHVLATYLGGVCVYLRDGVSL